MMFYYSQQKLIKRLALLESKGRGDEKGDKGAGKASNEQLKNFSNTKRNFGAWHCL